MSPELGRDGKSAWMSSGPSMCSEVLPTIHLSTKYAFGHTLALIFFVDVDYKHISIMYFEAEVKMLNNRKLRTQQEIYEIKLIVRMKS